jgi:predicted ferric reductase
MDHLRRERGGFLFFLLFGIIPLSLWLSTPGSQLNFQGYFAVMTMIAKIAGILGVSHFAGNIFLSARYKFIDRLFDGLDRAYLYHRKIGIAAFVLLTVHLVAITLRTWQTSFMDMVRFTLNYSYPPIVWGRVAYLGLCILVIITLFVRLKYERLKFLHTFMGVFLFFGGLHVYLIPSDVATNIYLRGYILGIVGIGLLSYLWRTVLKRWLIRRIIADVQAVNRLGDAVTEVVMKPRPGKIAFIPGQFIFVKFRQPGFPYEDHPFSLTASTEEGTLRISAKALGDFTTQLSELNSGAIAEIQGPFGGFSFTRAKTKKLIWIAGGIGITPFMSMARSMRDRSDLKEYGIHLFYSVKTESELIYGKELEDISTKVSSFSYHPWIAERDGFITAEAIAKRVDIIGKDIYICGPKPLLKALQSQFKNIGTPANQIHFELFRLL